MSFQQVTILGCGMMTAVGLTAPASCAAIRARLDNFRETRFIGPGGDWLVGAEVPLEEPWRGIPRLARLLAGPIGECLSACPDVPPETIPVLVCLAEEDRPGRLDGLGNPLFFEACNILRVRFHQESCLFPHGRVAGASALHVASRLIHEQNFPRVIVAGVDSYLVAATLAALGERDRLLTPTNSNGFIPGEAGAAVLVGASGQGLVVRGIGFGIEQATIESEAPLRANGLTAAFHQALTTAGLAMAEIAYRIGTMSGEQYWFKEFNLATSRLLRNRREFMDNWHPADCIGDTGAASILCCIGVALESACKRYAPGDHVAVTASNDDGRRVAAILSAGETI